jgi:type I restriction enzyme M protein
MILNRDGQSKLVSGDSIAAHGKWSEEIDVALCNPPFGERSIESRPTVLGEYDLGHIWTRNASGAWRKTEKLLDSQQLGILFIERCFKLLSNGGRMAIILPEGYLCTPSYGYVRQWLLQNMRVICLVELPRRIFLKSSADLRSNIVVAQKLQPKQLTALIKKNYPIHAELVRKVGYKLGAGFSAIAKRDVVTGVEVRDDENQVVIDSDFTGIRERFARFSEKFEWREPLSRQPKTFASFLGGKVRDILDHPELDMKPRRLTVNALENKRKLLAGSNLQLKDIADVITGLFDLESEEAKEKLWRLVEGMDIRANEGVVIPQFPARHWQIAAKKGSLVYPLQKHDIIIGLVRPERRNIGMLMHDGDNIVGSPDGIAVVRLKDEFRETYPETWLFAQLRSECSRLQFWTESGGTSYGKLTLPQIENVILAKPDADEVQKVHKAVLAWRQNFTTALHLWSSVGSESDRRPIINSPIIGLETLDESAISDE